MIVARLDPRYEWKLRPDPPEWPEHCCAILRDSAGRYMLERRAQSSVHAPGKLAFFGGKREIKEHPDRCLRREIKEELGWSIGALHLDVVVRLMAALPAPTGGSASDSPPRVIAWFYQGRPPRPNLKLRLLPGSEIVWISPEEVGSADLSPWHRAALEAAIRGDAVAWVDGGPGRE
jgi:8-oxo-dGTP pyrophosphatase MutT (NUDIX family)